FQPIISMVNLVRVGLTASMTWRQFSTVASKNSRDRFLGLGAYQIFGSYDPAISTQQRAPTASASAVRSVTYFRFARRFSASGSSMLTQAPTSAITTFSAAKAFWIASTRAVFSTVAAFGQ